MAAFIMMGPLCTHHVIRLDFAGCEQRCLAVPIDSAREGRSQRAPSDGIRISSATGEKPLTFIWPGLLR